MGIGLAFILFALALILSGVASWFISRKTYRSLKAHQSDWPTLISVIVFLVSFAVLAAGTAVLIGSTIRFQR